VLLLFFLIFVIATAFYLLSHNQLDFDRLATKMTYDEAYIHLSNVEFEAALWNVYLIVLG